MNQFEDEVRDTEENRTEEDTNQERHAENQEEMDLSPESSLNLSSKFEELVKKQISNESKELDTHNPGGRRTPIGDVASEPFQDGGGNRFVDDVVESPHSSMRSSGSHHVPQKTVEDIIREVNSASKDRKSVV